MGERKLAAVDTETGEIISDGSAYVRHASQDEGYRKKIEQDRFKGSPDQKHWIASYHEPINEISSDLSLTEAGAIIKLIPYIKFRSFGKLIKDDKPLKQAAIQRIFKRGKDATREILRNLEDKGVISVEKEGRSNVFFISAKFHEMGNVRNGDMFTKLYKVRTREITDGLELVEAGILYKILPYFHFSEYYLVDNPDEQDTDKLRYIGRDELADRIGMHRQDLSAAVRKLRNKGALMSTHSGRSVRYLVHPDIMFRQSMETDWTDAVRKLFEPHMKKAAQ